MSVERTFEKDIALHRPRRERRVLRPTQPVPKELTQEDILREIGIKLSKIESLLKAFRETLNEIKDVLITFGFEFHKNKKLAKVAMKYRKSSRERGRRFRERHGE